MTDIKRVWTAEELELHLSAWGEYGAEPGLAVYLAECTRLRAAVEVVSERDEGRSSEREVGFAEGYNAAIRHLRNAMEVPNEDE